MPAPAKSLIYAGLLWALAGCGPAPGAASAATATQSPVVFDEVERELGRRTDEMVLSDQKAYDDAKLASYAGDVLGKVTRGAGADRVPWTLRILDSSDISVRSAPAGYVFVTRGLLAFLGSEAELAAAFAHEVSHVSLHHWRTQTDFLEAHGIKDGDVSRLSNDDRLALLSKLRDDELAADARAVGVLARAGYAPSALGKVIDLFARLERQAGGNRAPDVLRTHPGTEARLRALGSAGTQGATNVEAYLSRIDGVIFGSDPQHGFLYGDRYVNPAADFELTLASPWRTRLVFGDLISALPGGSIALLSRSENGLTATRDAIAHGAPFVQATIAGHPALVGNVPQEQSLTARSIILDTTQGVYVFAVIVANDTQHDARVESALSSVKAVSEPALKAIRPLRVRVTKLEHAMSLRELDATKPSKTNLDTLALLNGVEPDRKLDAGTLVKRVDE